jgi:hypothetical protein
MSEIDYEKMLYTRASNMIKVQGILSIVFGSLGILIAGLFLLAGLFATVDASSYQAVSNFIFGFAVFVFAFLPHVYLLISGITLVRQPAARVARPLVIINLIVGVLWNLVILIFAIINLTQMNDYERGHEKHRHAA